MTIIGKALLTREALELFIDKLHTKGERVTAIIVVKSKESGKDFTYKIRARDKVARHFIIYVETGYNEFTFVYSIFGDYKPKVNKLEYYDKPAYGGGVFILNKLVLKDIDLIMNKAEIYHTGRCIKCNRVLTDLESINFGMGKTCRNE